MTFYEVIRIETNDMPIKIKSLISIRQGTTNSINVSPNHYFICIKSRILYALSDLLTPLRPCVGSACFFILGAFIQGMLAEIDKPICRLFCKININTKLAN